MTLVPLFPVCLFAVGKVISCLNTICSWPQIEMSPNDQGQTLEATEKVKI